MEQSLHDFVIAQLHDSKGKWPLISGATGVSKRTIEKISNGHIKDPGVSHIEKLATYFRAQSAQA